MVVGVMGAGIEKDFSFVKDELNNILDIPRDFEEDLYKKLFVSNTVIEYWRRIGYKPSYYYLFWTSNNCYFIVYICGFNKT